MLITRERVIRQPIPSELINITRKLSNFPTSINLANQFFDVGFKLIRENMFCLPFVKNELCFRSAGPGVNKLAYYSVPFVSDGLASFLFLEKEKTGIFVGRIIGSEAYRKRNDCFGMNFRDFIEKSPSRVSVFSFDRGLNVVESTDYYLNGDKEPGITKY